MEMKYFLKSFISSFHSIEGSFFHKELVEEINNLPDLSYGKQLELNYRIVALKGYHIETIVFPESSKKILKEIRNLKSIQEVFEFRIHLF